MTSRIRMIAMLSVVVMSTGVFGFWWRDTPAESVAEVPSSPKQVQPIAVGESIADITYKTLDDEPFRLAKEVVKKPAVVVYYRGGWCPYCNTQLSELREIEAELVALGYQILAVSPDKPEKLADSLVKHNPGYVLLSDATMAGARAFGIAFQMSDKLVERYKGYGIDLADSSGHSHHQLPVPSVFIVDTDGVVQFRYFNPNYKKRLSKDDVLAAARAARR